MPSLPSPRLQGVNVLPPEASGPQYARWRRGVRSAFVSKGTWGHCDGQNPMPMPSSGPNFFSPTPSSDPQPQLLEERKAWVKKDRDVKLDIFLSVADDIKLEVFEVGPPLPPSAMTAKEMLEALDARFASFRFEEYHHAFCHFLNLHIDQYSSLEDFNLEFQATLEDLLDHGQPMSNAQACSAYFSKLRCTQNPWVAKKLKEWDETEPQVADLIKDSPPWSIVRPLTTKPASQKSDPVSIPEESLADSPSNSDGEETPSEPSEVATVSSKSSHSRHSSRSTTRSQEITVHASYEDLTELDAFPNVPLGKLPAAPIPKRLSSKNSMAKMPLLPPINRPLPPLPPDAEKSRPNSKASTRASSPKLPATPKSVSDMSLKVPTPRTSTSSRPTTPRALEQVHPALRPNPPTPSKETHPALRQSSPTPPTEIHPALRPTTPAQPAEIHPALRPQTTDTTEPPQPQAKDHISAAMRPNPNTLTPPMTQFAFLASSPDLNLDLPSTLTAELSQRPKSSRAAIAPQPFRDSFSTWPPSNPPMHFGSNNSSVISLPLQGTNMPEYQDTIIEKPTEKEQKRRSILKFEQEEKRRSIIRFEPEEKRRSSLKVEHKTTRSLSPARIVGRLSAEISDEEKKHRKRSMSWSIKARLSAKHGIKEII